MANINNASYSHNKRKNKVVVPTAATRRQGMIWTTRGFEWVRADRVKYNPRHLPVRQIDTPDVVFLWRFVTAYFFS